MSTNRFIRVLDWLNHHDWPPATLSPVKAAAAASLVSFLFILFVDGGVVTQLGVWWVELPLLSLVPLLLPFVILYRSSWHRAMSRPARMMLAGLYATGIFAGVLMALLFALFASAVVFSSCLKNFTHFGHG